MSAIPATQETEVERLTHRVKMLEELLTRLVESNPWNPICADGERFGLFLVPALPTAKENEEIPVPSWNHLVIRAHPWRRQLYLQGRNLTARQLVGAMKANGWTIEETAEEFDVPVEAVNEAARYVELDGPRLRLEADFERFLTTKEGTAHAAPHLPR